MSRYILKRLLMMIPVVIGVIVLVFTIMYLTPGDPAEIMLGESATPEQLAAKRAELGTDQPYLVQLGNYIKKLVLHGDLGTSYTTGQSVTSEIVAKFPTTFKLAFMSVVVAVMDMGIQYDHPDLVANMWVNEGELNGEPNKDNDGNSKIGRASCRERV